MSENATANRRRLTGRVVSDKMDKTVTVIESEKLSTLSTESLLESRQNIMLMTTITSATLVIPF